MRQVLGSSEALFARTVGANAAGLEKSKGKVWQWSHLTQLLIMLLLSLVAVPVTRLFG